MKQQVAALVMRRFAAELYLDVTGKHGGDVQILLVSQEQIVAYSFNSLHPLCFFSVTVVNVIMATRSLTEVFILMRNNAAQNRHLFSEQVSKLLHSSTPESPESVSPC